jgi:hypothetical protein
MVVVVLGPDRIYLLPLDRAGIRNPYRVIVCTFRYCGRYLRSFSKSVLAAGCLQMVVSAQLKLEVDAKATPCLSSRDRHPWTSRQGCTDSLHRVRSLGFFREFPCHESVIAKVLPTCKETFNP